MMKNQKLLGGLLIAILLEIGLLISGANTNNIITNEPTSYTYGPGEKNFFVLTVPEKQIKAKKTKIVLLVHGGKLTSGSPYGSDMDVLADFFLDRGYAVARIGYRLCPDVKWPTPIEDIGRGVQSVYHFLRSDGFIMEDVTYAGFSAGALSGALLLHSEKYQSEAATHIDRFISLDGVFSPFALTGEATETRIKCGGDPKKDLVYSKKSRVPALLIEGNADAYDAQPMTKNSHAEFLAQTLREDSIYAETYWAKRKEKCGHDCPIALLGMKDREITRVIENFMEK